MSMRNLITRATATRWQRVVQMAVSAGCIAAASASAYADGLLYDVAVPSGATSNITEVIGAEYGDLYTHGTGKLILSAANEFTGSVTNYGTGVFIDVPVYDSPCVLTERSAVEITR